jgi:hypothetical protein
MFTSSQVIAGYYQIFQNKVVVFHYLWGSFPYKNKKKSSSIK